MKVQIIFCYYYYYYYYLFIYFSWMPNFLDGFHDVYDYFKYNGSLDQNPQKHYPLWLIEVSKILFSERQDIT